MRITQRTPRPTAPPTSSLPARAGRWVCGRDTNPRTWPRRASSMACSIARQQLAGIPLRLRHDLTRAAPTLRTVADARVEAPHVMRWPTHRAREQVGHPALEHLVGGQADRVLEVIRLQVLVQVGQREGRI